MTAENPRLERDRQMINEARARGTGAKMWAYTKLSGPGWLQSAITLGGGSLAGGLYLGVLGGYGLMWLQPLAMILGVIMLSAIGYVTLSTQERPFRAINQHISPVLGWGWAIASLMANLVWCMPQFALGTAALRQNLAPGVFGPEAMPDEAMAQGIIVGLLLLVAGTIVWFYNSGGWGIRLFETVLKIMVGIVVISFFGVVVRMSMSGDGLPWGEIMAGFIPDLSLLSKPSPQFDSFLAAAGDHAEWWRNRIVSEQQKVMITAVATAVGINMTFLLPYSMLARGWDRDFRGLAGFDLSTGLVIPFALATGCVVIASASQFHTRPEPGLVAADSTETTAKPAPNLVGGYNSLLDARLSAELGKDEFAALKKDDTALAAARAELPLADQRMAAILVQRDAFNLASSLAPLTGQTISQVVFGIGVLGMAISTIIMLMLINGFVVCEMCGMPAEGWLHRAGALMAGLTGAAGPFLWTGKAKVWLAVPTSMFGMVLLPIAYLTFFLMMNSESLLGKDMPRGGKRIAWNLALGIAVALAGFGSYWSVSSSPYATYGLIGLGLFLGLAVVVALVRRSGSPDDNAAAPAPVKVAGSAE